MPHTGEDLVLKVQNDTSQQTKVHTGVGWQSNQSPSRIDGHLEYTSALLMLLVLLCQLNC